MAALPWTGAATIDRRVRLRQAVAKMAVAIAAGECEPPAPVEIEALAQLCDEHFLLSEAARVRRWMGLPWLIRRC